MYLATALYAVFFIVYRCTEASSILKNIKDSITVTDSILDSIFHDWEVDRYPNFFHSGYMEKKSWDKLRNKFENKILTAELTRTPKNLTISFTGSSVTAGHDIFYSSSFPVLVGKLMKPAFELLNINLVSRNVAMGNNVY